MRIPINPDGSAGPPVVLAEGPALLAVDGITFDVHGNVVGVRDRAEHDRQRFAEQGHHDDRDRCGGLDWASSLAFGKNTDLWVVNFAIGPRRAWAGGPSARRGCEGTAAAVVAARPRVLSPNSGGAPQRGMPKDGTGFGRRPF